MNTLTELVRVYRALSNKSHEDNTIEGDLVVHDAAMRETLISADDEQVSIDIGLSALSEPADIDVGATVRVRLFASKQLPIFRDLSAFLGNGSRLLDPINSFYIIDKDWFSEDAEQPAESNNLKALQQVMVQLNESATIVDKEKRKLFFADGAGPVELPINVAQDDLVAVKPEVAAAFVEFCCDSLHRQHRLEAVSKVAIKLTRGMPANDRLHYILRNLDKMLSDAKSQHAVFLSAFSYEKVRDEIESMKVEYTTKIHKVLSDIQGQLLGIPAATVIVATQMKTAINTGSEFIANIAILLGAWIFGVFLILLLKNQQHTLDIIETEVNRQKRQLREELPEVTNKFDGIFTSLHERLRHQKNILITVDIVVVLGLLLSSYAFWFFSSSAVKLVFQP